MLGRGVTMALGRESMFTMSMLGVTPLIQEKLVERSGLDKNVALAAGSLTGALLAGVVTHPMDTIKTCMQGDLPRAKYAGVLATGRAIAAEHGVATGLFSWGTFSPSSVSVSVAVATFVIGDGVHHLSLIHI